MEQENSAGTPVETDYAWLAHYEPQVPHSVEIPDLTLPQLLENTASAYPANVATIFFGEKLTYLQLSDQVGRFAAGLRALGVKPGDRVAMVLTNSPQFIIALYGILKAGAVAVPLNPVYTADELRARFIDAGVTTVIVGDGAAQRAQEASANGPLERIIVTSIHDYRQPLMKLGLGLQGRAGAAPTIQGDNVYSLLNLIKASEPEQSEPRSSPDDTALLLYTGGTTGTPRGVLLSHRNLVASAQQMNAWVWDAREERREVFLGLMPLFHSYGLTVVMNLAVSIGGAILLLPRFTMKELLRAIARFRPTIFPAAPTIYNAIVNYPLVERYDLRSIRVCISSGGPMPQAVAQAFEGITGARLVESYGLTETSSLTHCNPVHGERRTGSIGLPVPLTEAIVVDPISREPLPAGEIGELAVRGPQVMQGYWTQGEEVERMAPGEWLYTGDIARRDEAGYFYIIDRKNDVIFVDGFDVYPREVEDVLYECDKVEEVVVVGVPDKQRGVIVKAYVVLKADMEVTERELRAFCAERLAGYKVPARIEFRAGLPRSNTGKYLRRELVREEHEPVVAAGTKS